jgi:23S rRNA (guanine2445-N2)-methyltransferase / 23S rRNA (guanine2069-N7)-methyltransferase
MTMDFFATTAQGMEHLLCDELRALGAEITSETRAGASFRGELELAYRACLWSRTANRILMPLCTFPAADETALYEGVRTIRWSEHLTPAQTIAVDCRSSRSKITHAHFGALKTKDAIVDQFRDERNERPSVKVVEPDVRVNVYLHEDEATISLDLSGESLHRRGYRAQAAEAPLKETLAAAILLLADWPALSKLGTPLLDPMCGSGTLPIEAALIAADIAPGLKRSYFGFLNWLGHDARMWHRVLAEAEASEIRDAKRIPPIVGFDVDGRAVRIALENVERAGLRGRVHIEKRELSEVRPLERRRAPRSEGPLGVLVSNPPYGERMGEEDSLGLLYETIGNLLRREFTGWTGYVFTGNPELAKRVGLRAAKRHILWNGAIECRLLEFPISKEKVRATDDPGPAWRKPRPLRPPAPEAQMFVNRLQKNWRHLRKWAKREGVSCYRIYDADLPEYAVAVDLYEQSAHVQEYQAPKTVDEKKAEERLEDIMALLPEALGLPRKDIFLKVRRRQRGREQYEKQGSESAVREVSEGGHRFLINLSDYLDTGLFLDDRRLRAMIGEAARDRDFLNLFCYTATATVYAAKGGATSTTSVDLSNTYLDWAQQNFALNNIAGNTHHLVRANCSEWLAEPRSPYGLIFLAPPTFSNSTRMDTVFDLQQGYIHLVEKCADLLTPDGILFFSTNFRRFKFNPAAFPGLRSENISRKTIPQDFARDPRVHQTWKIVRR